MLRARLAFLRRVAGLFSGIVLGQGSVFGLQTFLMLEGKSSATASIGVAISVLSLVQWLSDWGGLFLLARLGSGPATRAQLFEALLVRLGVGIVVCGGQWAFAHWYFSSNSAASSIIFGAIGLGPIWAFNLTGYLDGRGKGALSGPTVALPWVGAAAAGFIVLAADEPSVGSLELVGFLFLLGATICVALQHILAWQDIRLLDPGPFDRKRAVGFLGEGFMMCVGDLPGQLYGRTVMVLVADHFPSVAGAFVYIRQMINAASQGLLLIKRAELPALSEATRSGQHIRVGRLLQVHALSTLCSFLLFFGSLGWAIFLHSVDTRLSLVRGYLPYFAIGMPLFAISQTLGLILILQQRVRAYSITLASTVILNAGLVFLFSPKLGIISIAAFEVVQYVIQIIFFGAFVFLQERRDGRAPKSAPA